MALLAVRPGLQPQRVPSAAAVWRMEPSLRPCLLTQAPPLIRGTERHGPEIRLMAAPTPVIDFNPRFYSYLAFDHARGLPQAYLAYLLAIGAHDELATEIERANAAAHGAKQMVFTYRIGAWTQLLLERLFRRISSKETARWRAWRKRARTVVDPVWAPDDVGPVVADLLVWMWNMVRHPRNFLRRSPQTML